LGSSTTTTHNKNIQHTINNKNTQQPIYIHTPIHTYSHQPYTYTHTPIHIHTTTTHIGYYIQRSSSLGFIQKTTRNKNTQHTINNKNTQQPIYIHTHIPIHTHNNHAYRLQNKGLRRLGSSNNNTQQKHNTQ